VEHNREFELPGRSQ
jgi:hypothetical protein